MQEDISTLNQLNEAWHDAYRQRNRASLSEILAEDFLAFFPDGEAVDRKTLITAEEPSDLDIKSIFSESALHLFGETAITKGRVDLTMNDDVMSQRFVRVWAKREGRWWAVAVQVFPVTD